MKQVILVRTDLKMPKGKISVQCSHASVESVLKSSKDIKVMKNGKEVTDRDLRDSITASELQSIRDLFTAASNLVNTFSAEGDPSVQDTISLKEAVRNFPEIRLIGLRIGSRVFLQRVNTLRKQWNF